MISGRDALHRLDAEIASARKQVARASDAAASEARERARLDERELEAFRALAAIRLDLLKNGEIDASLGGADRKAKALLASHEETLAALSGELEDASSEVARLEGERRRAETALAEAIERHDDAAAATRKRLEEDADYEALAAALEEAEAIARRARQKLDLARADREEKGAPYEADPLFTYLHERKFGTRDYRAFPLFALLDRWVARLVRYRDASANYRRLCELPERLDEHLERVEAAAAERAEAIEAYERAALEQDGVGALRKAAETARARLEEIDAAIAAAETRLDESQARFNEIAAGDTGPMGEARALLAETLARLRVPDLKVLAAETETPEDDRLVEELIVIRREKLELEESRRAERAALEQRSRALSDLEELRRRFKRAHYDSPYSEFPGRDLIGALLLELLRSSMDRDAVWRRIERSQRTRRRDWNGDFGGADWRGGFGGPRQTSRRTRMPRAPRSPRPPRRGGGFKTGGGF